MAFVSSTPFVAVNLTENDVPGASLQEDKSIEQHNMTQLKRFLLCRGQKVGGKKRDLVDRVKTCLTRNEPIFQGIDQGTWYRKKLKRINEGHEEQQQEDLGSLPPPFPITGWKKFPTINIPATFCFGIIHEHFLNVPLVIFSATSAGEVIESEEEEDIGLVVKDCNTSKPVPRGEVFFKSGNVQNLMNNQAQGHYCIKSDVMASMKKKTYKVLVMLHKDTAKVFDSKCDCPASALGRCSHVAAVLFALMDYVQRFGYTMTACTSKRCTWNVGRTANRNPTRIAENTYNFKSDATKVEYRPTMYEEPPFDLNNKLLFDAQQLEQETMWELSLQYHYLDYELTEERRKELGENVKQLQNSLLFNSDQPCEVENTCGQSTNENWVTLRKFFITASICKNAYNIKPEAYKKYLKNMLWSTKPGFQTKYTSQGIRCEALAREEYELQTGYTVTETGLWINPNHIGLACSPDGLVDDNNQSSGLLEIKCPFVLKDYDPTELSKLTPQQRSQFCCKLDENNKLQLKENHKYYFQVQMCMGILERKWCDFVIWTYKGMHCERIIFNEELWKQISCKLSKFHENVYCPELFGMRVPRNLDRAFRFRKKIG